MNFILIGNKFVQMNRLFEKPYMLHCKNAKNHFKTVGYLDFSNSFLEDVTIIEDWRATEKTVAMKLSLMRFLKPTAQKKLSSQ